MEGDLVDLEGLFQEDEDFQILACLWNLLEPAIVCFCLRFPGTLVLGSVGCSCCVQSTGACTGFAGQCFRR